VKTIKKIGGGVTAAAGFVAGATFCGIKRKKGSTKPDLALIFSREPAVAAATFTTNKIKAAPVKVSMAHLKSPSTRGIIANSGNANACTGPEGVCGARQTTEAAAAALGTEPREILVCSTGRIGVRLPIEKMEPRIPQLAKQLTRRGSLAAARAIMTSDTFPKEWAVSFEVQGRKVKVGGIAKGAGMIDPNMATMLCFLSTDAKISKRDLQKALSESVEQSFNRITVDGDMSTNDTVLLLANGASGCVIQPGSHGWNVFKEALNKVTRNLARMIVEDGEGVSKFVEVQVRGAATYQDGRKVAEAIANSTLVKCAWAGNDPNWGRIVDAAGYSGAKLSEEMINVYYNGLLAVKGGAPGPAPESKLRQVVRKKRFTVCVDLQMGSAEYTAYTTDLTEEYVRLNLSE
jgi:glutamate N-acetyltransferase/amino-acid N-acetyltransferase